MKLVVFGATGRIGRQLVQQALAAGHEVTAFQHHTHVSSDYQGTLHIAQGDLLDLPSVEMVMPEQDTILAVHGAHNRKEVSIYTQGTQNILHAMHKFGIKRLVCITSAAVDDDPAVDFFFRKIIKPLFLKEVYHALQQIEQDVEHSGLDWTIVRPGALTTGPHTGIYRISDLGIPKNGTKIACADVADLMLKEASNTYSLHKKIFIMY